MWYVLSRKLWIVAYALAYFKPTKLANDDSIWFGSDTFRVVCHLFFFFWWGEGANGVAAMKLEPINCAPRVPRVLCLWRARNCSTTSECVRATGEQTWIPSTLSFQTYSDKFFRCLSTLRLVATAVVSDRSRSRGKRCYIHRRSDMSRKWSLAHTADDFNGKRVQKVCRKSQKTICEFVKFALILVVSVYRWAFSPVSLYNNALLLPGVHKTKRYQTAGTHRYTRRPIEHCCTVAVPTYCLPHKETGHGEAETWRGVSLDGKSEEQYRRDEKQQTQTAVCRHCVPRWYRRLQQICLPAPN